MSTSSVVQQCRSEVSVKCRSEDYSEVSRRSDVLLRSFAQKCRSEASIRRVAQKCRSEALLREVSIRCVAQQCPSQVSLRSVAQRCCSEASVRSVAQKCRSRSDLCVCVELSLDCRSGASPRSVADVRVEVHVAQKRRSEVLSEGSLRSIAQKRCSEVLLRHVAHRNVAQSVVQKCRSVVFVEMSPKLSLSSAANRRRLHICVCVKVSLEVLLRSVAYVCVEVS